MGEKAKGKEQKANGLPRPDDDSVPNGARNDVEPENSTETLKH